MEIPHVNIGIVGAANVGKRTLQRAMMRNDFKYDPPIYSPVVSDIFLCALEFYGVLIPYLVKDIYLVRNTNRHICQSLV